MVDYLEPYLVFVRVVKKVDLRESSKAESLAWKMVVMLEH